MVCVGRGDCAPAETPRRTHAARETIRVSLACSISASPVWSGTGSMRRDLRIVPPCVRPIIAQSARQMATATRKPEGGVLAGTT